MKKSFVSKNLTCCSVELDWKNVFDDNLNNNNIYYELEQKESNVIFSSSKIYEGQDTNYEAINLLPDTEYIFTLTILRNNKTIGEKKTCIKTHKSPVAILSQDSINIANGTKKNYSNNLNDLKNNIIQFCSKLIFVENDQNVLKGDFSGIEIKIAHEEKNNIYYISFDLKKDYFNEFFMQFIKEYDNELIVPCHFIIQKLPTILIFNLMKRGSIILTGKRMGGVIASSLAFYILYLEKVINKAEELKYGNTFEKQGSEGENNNIGVVTFGSPSFLTNLTAGIKMQNYTNYFYNIKTELDFIPPIVDFINKNNKLNDNILSIFRKNIFDKEDTKRLSDYLNDNNFTKNQFETHINRNVKIPFGFYFKFDKSNNELLSIDENNFDKFYYFNLFDSKNISNLIEYRKLIPNLNFNKDQIKFLESKDLKLEYIKIFRRNITVNNMEKMKGILKFKLDNTFITPDIITGMTLNVNNQKSINIKLEDIYYDNDTDVTAYIEGLNENINTIIISNAFSGKIEFKQIINIKGSGPTREMILDNLEKLFLISYSKLFEIFCASFENNDKKYNDHIYNDLKKENFGENFQDIKILKPFKKQIKTINELLFLSRPDILGKNESKFKSKINQLKIEDGKIFSGDYIIKYYEEAKKIQNQQGIKCILSDNDSIAKSISFPLKKKGEIKKLFMCDRNFLTKNNFLWEYPDDDTYIKKFFVEKIIAESLVKIEKEIKDSNDLNKISPKDLNKQVGEFYQKYIIPNFIFIYLIILTSIEYEEQININMKYILKQLVNNYPVFFFYLNIFIRDKNIWEIFSKKKVEETRMKTIFYKKKIKQIINSNFNLNDKKTIISLLFNKNKIFEFSEYNQDNKVNKSYYETFLDILNNYSNEFPEDIETSIYENLRKENESKENNLLMIKEILNDFISDEESKIGFMALLRQSYLLGKLRQNIVSIYYI